MPEITSRQLKDFLPPWLLLPAIIFFILFLSAGVGSLIFERIYQNKIYPNVFTGSLNLGGRTAEAARQLINREVDKISQQGVVFSYKGSQTTIMPVVASADADLAYQIISFNSDQTANAALSYGRGGNFFSNLADKLTTLLFKKRLPLAVSASRKEIEKILKNNFAKAFEPAQDAKLIIKALPGADYQFSVADEKFGKTIDYQEAIGLMINNLAGLDNREIQLATVTEYPKILAKDCLNIESKARAILAQAPLTLKYNDLEWTINRDQLSAMLSLMLNDSATDKVHPVKSDKVGTRPVKYATHPEGISQDKQFDGVKVGLDRAEIKNFLTAEVIPKIDIKPQEAKFEINNGKVNEFQNGQDGLALDLEATLAKIENEIMANNQIELAVKVEPALTSAGNINNFGIKEIIGVGTSNFAGSPVNRRHNIKVGASAVNGTLIKPGEEFSLLKTLGEVVSSTGYLPELVIKEGKTIPEFGGGLCQIGTTVFRATIASGLPVTLRRNHSYRVVYYEPAGTDATIYNPWPDYRFINDLPTYILIQAKFSGDNLSFEFWGTKDGRVMEKTQPTIYNIVKPEPAKIIETTDLKPGVKKCTEKAHNGADAYFDYKVTYPDGQIKQKRFSSHYVPWQEVCLLGVEKLSIPPPDSATSTPPTAAN